MATILRAIGEYWLLVIVVRAIGRRPGGQLTPFEFVLVFFIGGISIQAVVADDRSLINALLAVSAVAMMHVLVSTLKQRYPSFGKLIDGTPVVILEKGHWHSQRMTHHGVQEADVMAAARMRGVPTEEKIKYAIIERNGQISIIEADQD